VEFMAGGGSSFLMVEQGGRHKSILDFLTQRRGRHPVLSKGEKIGVKFTIQQKERSPSALS